MRCDCDICKMGRKINDLINDLINRYGLSEKDKDLLLDTLPPCLEYVDIRTVNFFELEAKDKRIEELLVIAENLLEWCIEPDKKLIYRERLQALKGERNEQHKKMS
jgi:hypothetical protein